MDRSTIEQLQMHGQDIPWLLQHWADEKPDHPALIWEPVDAPVETWTYAELVSATRSLAAGLRDRGIELGDKVLIHADNCPEMLLAWLACATLGAVAVTTNTRSVPTEVGWFIDHSQCVAAITQPQFVEHVGAASRDLRWVAIIGDPADAGTNISFDDLRGDGDSWAGRAIEPLRPF